MPAINYEHNLYQVKLIAGLAEAAGVSRERVAIFNADGVDPEPDLALQAGAEPEHWLLTGTRAARAASVPRSLTSTELPGATPRAATKAGIGAWFEDAKGKLRPGDVLLLFVVGHGVADAKDPQKHAIILWKRERLDVTELGTLLDGLDPGVRVVASMSECHSGAFATLATRGAGDGHARAPFCGYFSSAPERPGYGCSVDDLLHPRAGYGVRFLRELARGLSLVEAHEVALVEDDAHDAPRRSSDAHLEAVLRRVASERGVTADALVDELLGAGFRSDPAWEAPRARVDRLGARIGLAEVRSLAEVSARREEILGLERSFDAAAKAWRGAWTDLAADNFKAFLGTNAAWNERFGGADRKGLPEAGSARAEAPQLIAELEAFTTKERRDRILAYRDRSETSGEARFRALVRGAAAERVRTELETVAGRILFSRGAAPADAATWKALRACEDIKLPVRPAPPPPLPASPPLASLADDVRLDAEVHPAWAGFNFGEVPPVLRKLPQVNGGSAAVAAVYPGSPASAAGLEVGDIVIGTPGRAFEEHGDLRAWSLLSPIGKPAPLEILRNAARLTITLTPTALPPKLPALPPALTVGRTAPALDLRPYRGAKTSLADGRPHLLMFWATWCAPCKVALPELLAFERERKVQVVAVTDEENETLDAFFKKFGSPFPKTIAIDEARRAFDAFGVRTRPLFVLLDGKGTVTWRRAGYEKNKGLGVEDWTYRGK